jgi:transposase
MRLCARYRRLLTRGKHKNTIVTAIARELAAYLWAIGQAVEPVTA